MLRDRVERFGDRRCAIGLNVFRRSARRSSKDCRSRGERRGRRGRTAWARERGKIVLFSGYAAKSLYKCRCSWYNISDHYKAMTEDKSVAQPFQREPQSGEKRRTGRGRVSPPSPQGEQKSVVLRAVIVSALPKKAYDGMFWWSLFVFPKTRGTFFEIGSVRRKGDGSGAKDVFQS